MLSFGQCTKKTNNVTFFMLQQLPLLHICEKKRKKCPWSRTCFLDTRTPFPSQSHGLRGLGTSHCWFGIKERVLEMRRATTGTLASGICDCALYPIYAVQSYPAAHLQGSLRTFIFLLYLKYPHKVLLGEKEETELVVQRV